MATARPSLEDNPLEHTFDTMKGGLQRDPDGEYMTLNMGPSHPSTHGVLQIVLDLDGERIVDARPEIGYLHRGMEKIAETYGYNKFIPYTDRMDYLAPISNNIAVALGIEAVNGS